MADQSSHRAEARTSTGVADDETSGTGATNAADESTGERPVTDPRAQAQITELDDRWRRAVAELENFRKRVARDADQQRASERSRVAAEWLPVLDNLELALQHAESDPTAIISGIEAVREQAMAVLSRLGFPRRDDVGEAFDPARHEAVASVEDDSVPAGTVVQVLRPGYGTEGQPLRPASVVVAKRPADASEA
jgi:molecular chaperone GrpE